MIEPESNTDILDQAALYALGALEGEELQLFEKRVAEEPAVCRIVKEFQEVAGKLGTVAKPVQPSADLRAKLFQRVRSEAGASPEKIVERPLHSEPPPVGLTFVEAGNDGWQEILPGIKLKILFFDQAQGRMTALARMAAGCNYDAHRHDKPEEIFVLEGTCYCGGRLLNPGDYHRAEVGTIHNETSTTDGCLMLLIFSPNNETLDPVPSS